jgi:hypothetical protein
MEYNRNDIIIDIVLKKLHNNTFSSILFVDFLKDLEEKQIIIDSVKLHQVLKIAEAKELLYIAKEDMDLGLYVSISEKGTLIIDEFSSYLTYLFHTEKEFKKNKRENFIKIYIPIFISALSFAFSIYCFVNNKSLEKKINSQKISIDSLKTEILKSKFHR